MLKASVEAAQLDERVDQARKDDSLWPALHHWSDAAESLEEAVERARPELQQDAAAPPQQYEVKKSPLPDLRRLTDGRPAPVIVRLPASTPVARNLPSKPIPPLPPGTARRGTAREICLGCSSATISSATWSRRAWKRLSRISPPRHTGRSPTARPASSGRTWRGWTRSSRACAERRGTRCSKGRTRSAPSSSG